MPDDLKKTAAVAEALAHRPARPRPRWTKDRSWEKAQRNAVFTTQVSYRGMPRALNEEMKRIAQANGMNVSQVAVRFMAFALEQYDRGFSLAKMGDILDEW